MNIIKQLTKKQILYLVLIIVWMIVVFGFSAQPAEKSSQTSGGITEKIVKAIVKEPEKLSQENIDMLETIIRKIAHFEIYLVGGFLIAGFFYTTNITNKHKIMYAILFTTMYACTDEIHQFFVEGRACMVMDVFIDCLGASTGTCIYILGRKILRRN